MPLPMLTWPHVGTRVQVGTACWQRLRELHAQNPFNLLLGTGDQLYNDNVWAVPAAAQWASIQPKDKMRDTALTDAAVQQIRSFYFGAYLRWIEYHPLVEDQASIPQVSPSAPRLHFL
jgi:hypothetical protein